MDRTSSFRRSVAIGLLALAWTAPGCGTAPSAAPDPLPADQVRLVERADAALARSSAFLVARQHADGAWRSQVYGLLKDGPSLTPHVATMLFFLPQGGPPARDAFERGMGYLVGLVDERGRVRDGVSLIYPVYTAAECSRMIAKADPTRERRAAQAGWLALVRRHQLTEPLDWRGSDLEYGGWSYAPEPPRRPPPGQERGPWDWSNLSSTLYGIATLRSAKVPATDPAYRAALVFIQRCQNFADPRSGVLPDPRSGVLPERGLKSPDQFDDGGFFFSPAEPTMNKAGPAGRDADGRQRFNSYGSMTADGVRGLLDCGLPPDHPRVRAAAGWIAANYSVRHNPGRFPQENEDLRDAVYYYYCWGLAHALMRLEVRRLDTPTGPTDWAVELAEELLARQRPDGSWVNRLTEGKEDDPLVATPLAAAALAICRHVIAGQSGPPCLPAGPWLGPPAAGG